MEQIILNIKFKELGLERELRLDTKYNYFRKELIPTIYPAKKFLRLKEFKGNGTNVIFTSRGTFGVIHFDKKNVNIHAIVELQIDDDKLEKNFLYEYSLTSLYQQQMQYLKWGSTVGGINKNEVEKILFPNITIKEQKDILNKIGPKLSEIRRIEGEIESLQDIIDDVFGKYGYSTKPRLKKEEYIFNNKFENISKTNWLSIRTYLCRFIEEELPTFIKENLKGRYMPFTNYIKRISSGEYIPKKYYSSYDTNFVYLRINNISSNELNLEDLIFLQNTIGEQYKNIAINKNNLILTRSGTVGKCIIFDKEPDDERIFIPSHHLAVLEFNNLGDALFLKYYLQSSFGSDFFWAFSTGKSQKEITNWSIRKLPIPAINRKIQQKIVSEIQQREEKTNQYKEQIKKLRKEIDDLIYQSLQK
jgi:restriction endonuclease S subunit